VVGGFEFADDRLHTESDLKAMLPVTILSDVPEIVQPSDEAKRRRRVVIGWAATSIVVLAIAAGATVSLLCG
jgi:hypothetical protein